jgi:hypothetical protein
MNYSLDGWTDQGMQVGLVCRLRMVGSYNVSYGGWASTSNLGTSIRRRSAKGTATNAEVSQNMTAHQQQTHTSSPKRHQLSGCIATRHGQCQITLHNLSARSNKNNDINKQLDDELDKELAGNAHA